MPSLVFGVAASFAGLLYVFLPETLGHVLPDTIEEAERLSRRTNTKRESVSVQSFSQFYIKYQFNVKWVI